MKDIALQIHECSALMKRRFEQLARPSKLTLLQWRVLGYLAREGTQRQSAVGEALSASPMAISEVADRLETAGLLDRNPAPDDSRAKEMSVTETGRRKVDHMRGVADAAFRAAFEGVSQEDLAALRRALPQIISNLGSQKTLAMADQK